MTATEEASLIVALTALVAHGWIGTSCTREVKRLSDSVLNVECVAKCSVERRALFIAEVPDWFLCQGGLGYRHNVVAIDDADFGQPFVSPYFDLGANPSNGSSDGRAGYRSQHANGRVTCQDADWATAGWRTQIGPHHIASTHHSGDVSAASRAAAETMAGSCGVRRYAA